MSRLAGGEQDRSRQGMLGALIVGGVALVPCIIGAFFSPTQFFRAWLAAWLFYLGLPLGGMVVLMIYRLTGGAWGYLIRRFLEAQMRTLPLLAILFIPIGCGIGYLYLWAQPEVIAGQKHIEGMLWYLNRPFFLGRAAAYFVIWLAMAYFFSTWSWRHDHTGDPRFERLSRRWSGYGLVLFGLSFHFAAIDWGMSLQPMFPSTIWGPLLVAGQVLSAHAFALVALAVLADRPPIAEAMSLKGLNDLGNLLLAFLVIWAYMEWFQFMIVWIANLPEDVIWYLPMNRPGWIAVGVFLLVARFAVPFFLLLVRAVKQRPPLLAGVAGLLLFTQLVFNYLQVTPMFYTESLGEHWMDFLTPIAIGGLWLAAFLYTWSRWPVLARNDANEAEAIHLRQLDEEEAAREEALTHG